MSVGIFLFVVVQRASVPWFLQWAKVDGAYPFSSNSIVVSVAFLEIILGVSIACWGRGLYQGLVETLCPRELRKWFWLGLPQAVGDMLELYANKYLDASTYQLLLQSKLLVTAVLMATVTQRGLRQSPLEWLNLVALSLALLTYSILSNGSGSFSVLGTLLATMKVVLSCANAVFTERILKQSNGIPLVHQIVHMKVFWWLWSVVCVALVEGPQVYAPAQFFRGWSVSVFIVMITYIVKNWSGTFLLKHLDSLLKNIAEAFAMLVLYVLEISPFFGTQKVLELPTFCITMMVVILVCAYLESKKRACERSTGKHMSLTEFLRLPAAVPTVAVGVPVFEWQRQRLAKKWGLLPLRAPAEALSGCRLVANRNASHSDLQQAQSQTSLSRSRLSLASLADPLDVDRLPADVLESGKQDAETPRTPEEASGPSSSCGLIDTIQELLQTSLDAKQGNWQDNVLRALNMCKGLSPYMEKVSSKLSPECYAIAEATRNADWPQLYQTGRTLECYHSSMMTSQVTAQMISFFCSMLSAKRILEIGSFTGFSTLVVAEATYGKVTAIERDPFLVEFAQKMFDRSEHGHKIKMLCGDACDVIMNMGIAMDDDDRFDLIFVDGNKTQYTQYLRLINDRDLLAPGGLICFDETLWKGSVYSPGQSSNFDGCVAQAMRELNAAIAADTRLVSILLPIRNGLTLVRRLDDHVANERDRFNAQHLPPGLARGQGAGPLQRRGRSPRQQTGERLTGGGGGPFSLSIVEVSVVGSTAPPGPQHEELLALQQQKPTDQGGPRYRQCSGESAESEYDVFERHQTC